MKEPHLLALVTDAFGGRGGIAQYNRDLLTALASDWSIEVLPRHAPDSTGPLPETLKQAKARTGRLRYVISAVLQARRSKPTSVFCGHLYMAPLAALIAWLVGAKLIVQMHGIEAWQRPSRLQRWSVERASLILCVSRYTRSRVLTWAAITPERVCVLPNTIRPQFSLGDRLAARRRFKLENQMVLLTVGRLAATERYKGQDHVIAALSQLQAIESRDLIYLIAGEGDDRARLESLVAQHGVLDKVRFLGAIDNQALPDLYRAADLFVMPSTGEGFGISFVESMACGTPAFGLRDGGARDALAVNANPGMLATYRDAESVFHNLRECLSRLSPDFSAALLASNVQNSFGRPLFARRALNLMQLFT